MQIWAIKLMKIRLEILIRGKKKKEESHLSRSGFYNLCEILQIALNQSD